MQVIHSSIVVCTERKLQKNAEPKKHIAVKYPGTCSNNTCILYVLCLFSVAQFHAKRHAQLPALVVTATCKKSLPRPKPNQRFQSTTSRTNTCPRCYGPRNNPNLNFTEKDPMLSSARRADSSFQSKRTDGSLRNTWISTYGLGNKKKKTIRDLSFSDTV